MPASPTAPGTAGTAPSSRPAAGSAAGSAAGPALCLGVRLLALFWVWFIKPVRVSI